MLKAIEAPVKQGWDSAAEAVQDAIELEKDVNKVIRAWNFSVETSLVETVIIRVIEIHQKLLIRNNGDYESRFWLQLTTSKLLLNYFT